MLFFSDKIIYLVCWYLFKCRCGYQFQTRNWNEYEEGHTRYVVVMSFSPRSKSRSSHTSHSYKLTHWLLNYFRMGIKMTKFTQNDIYFNLLVSNSIIIFYNLALWGYNMSHMIFQNTLPESSPIYLQIAVNYQQLTTQFPGLNARLYLVAHLMYYYHLSYSIFGSCYWN